jgi:hypothetical protein
MGRDRQVNVLGRCLHVPPSSLPWPVFLPFLPCGRRLHLDEASDLVRLRLSEFLEVKRFNENRQRRLPWFLAMIVDPAELPWIHSELAGHLDMCLRETVSLFRFDDEQELLASAGENVSLTKGAPATAQVLDAGDVAARDGGACRSHGKPGRGRRDGERKHAEERQEARARQGGSGGGER